MEDSIYLGQMWVLEEYLALDSQTKLIYVCYFRLDYLFEGIASIGGYVPSMIDLPHAPFT